METKTLLKNEGFYFKFNRDIAIDIDNLKDIESAFKKQFEEGQQKLNIDFSLYDISVEICEDGDDFINNMITVLVIYRPKEKQSRKGNYKDYLNI